MFREEIIYKTLKLLSRRFDRVQNTHTRYTTTELESICKMAILELGGWIECTLDAILKDYVYRKIVDPVEVNCIEREIDRVFGFSYERNFKPLMERIIGVERFHKIKCKLRAKGKWDPFVSELNVCWHVRGIAAHTNFNGVARSFDAPSVTISRFRKLYPVVSEIRRMIVKM